MDSSPSRRTGPLWQTRPNTENALKLVIELTFHPNRFFRSMRVDGSNLTARLFLLIVSLLIGLMWFYTVWGRSLAKGDTSWAVLQGALACDSVIVLSYIEAMGVVYFSRRRGWRVPFRLAERVACYSSIGWVPAALIMLVVLANVLNGNVDRWMQQLMPAWEYWQSLALLMLVFAIAMMGFEVLVWIGVRQTRYANA